MKIESAVLRRLGPVPYWRGENKCLAELDRIYRRASAHAGEILYGRQAPVSRLRSCTGVSEIV